MAVESPPMAATIIDGKQIAADVRAEVKTGATQLTEQTGVVPGLATVLVGDDPASHKYVSMKQKACAEARPMPDAAPVTRATFPSTSPATACRAPPRPSRDA